MLNKLLCACTVTLLRWVGNTHTVLLSCAQFIVIVDMLIVNECKIQKAHNMPILPYLLHSLRVEFIWLNLRGEANEQQDEKGGRMRERMKRAGSISLEVSMP